MRRTATKWAGIVAGAFLLVGACTAGKGSVFNEDDDDDGTGNAGAGATSAGGGGTGAQAGFDPGDGGNGASGNICDASPDEDKDADGYSINGGDCNDCDDNVNPDAIEVLTDSNDPNAEPADEDCDGDIDETIDPCDASYLLDDPDPVHAAHAIEICQQTTSGTGWGLIDARWVRANGPDTSASVQVGILDNFGPNMPPRMGAKLVGISSGNARIEGQPGACNSDSCQHQSGTAPANFPQNVPNCEGGPGTAINDDVGLQVTLRAPSNADGYQFDFAFYSFEFPEYVCTRFNDQFIALVDPAPPGAINGNISFDSQTNPVSVNIAMFDHCNPAGIGMYAAWCNTGCPSPPNPYCPNGTAIMLGTGFEVWSGNDAGATGWLVTTAPIAGGEEFTIRFAIWDTGDRRLDSTTVIDNFQWIAQAGTVSVGTTPVPR